MNKYVTDSMVEAVRSVVSEKVYKKGATVTFTQQDGDEIKAKVVSYDAKKKLYTIKVKGYEVEAEPEELAESSDIEEDANSFFRQTFKLSEVEASLKKNGVSAAGLAKFYKVEPRVRNPKGPIIDKASGNATGKQILDAIASAIGVGAMSLQSKVQRDLGGTSGASLATSNKDLMK